eukprot:164790-Chlamydomonas_euryale.AAC.2
MLTSAPASSSSLVSSSLPESTWWNRHARGGQGGSDRHSESRKADMGQIFLMKWTAQQKCC